MFNYLADFSGDPRLHVALTFEVEYAEVIYSKRVAHFRSITRQGFPGKFGVMDLAEHYWFVDRVGTSALVADYSNIMPKTHAAMEAVGTSD